MNYYSNILKFFFFIFLLTRSLLASQCESNENLKIGLINQNFINYEPYLLYTLGNYASNQNLEFEISFVENNADKFDIIFGEYHEIDKFSKYDIEYPEEILTFYKNNGISISNNILPLDLDTFILLSHENHNKLNIQDLSKYYDPTKYTIGMNISNKKNFINLINYNFDINNNLNKDLALESILHHYSHIYKNLNKNIINSNFLEIFESYESKENVFTLFSDSILIYKNINYSSFQIFPKSKYIWNSQKGIFEDRKTFDPISNFGFSAYINTTNNLGFICFLIKEDVRIKTFQNFNIQISPLSVNEIKSIEKSLPENYMEILKNKRDFISYNEVHYKNDLYDFLLSSIKNEANILENFNKKNYLN